MKVLVAGHSCVDISPRLDGHPPRLEPGILYPVGELDIRLGGSVANTGGSLAQLGVETELVTALGHDHLGLLGRSLFAEIGASVQVLDCELSTSYSIITEHSDHDRTIWQYEGSNESFDPRQIDLRAARPDLLHIGYPSLLPVLCRDHEALAETFRTAHQLGIVTSLDLAHVAEGSLASSVDWASWFQATLPHTDICSPSWDDVSSATGTKHPASREALQDAARQLIDQGAAVAQISAGKLGFVLRTGPASRFASAGHGLARIADQWADRELWFDAEHIPAPATTLGAGDRLTAGLLHAITKQMPPEQAGAHAAKIVGRHLRQEPLA